MIDTKIINHLWVSIRKTNIKKTVIDSDKKKNSNRNGIVSREIRLNHIII